MASWDTSYSLCYVLRGEGDIAAATAVQAQMREHGLCSYFNWDPRPPKWRFFYETNFDRAQVEQALGTLLVRFKIHIED
jgi:hypothetical protein